MLTKAPTSALRKARSSWLAACKALRHWLFPSRNDSDACRRLGELVALEDRSLLSATPLTATRDLIIANAAASTRGQLSSQLLIGGVTDSLKPASDPALASNTQVMQAGMASAQVRREVVFVDAAVRNADQIVKDIQGQANSTRSIDVYVLKGGSSGVEQMGEILAGYTGLDAVHVIAHGRDGGVQLGTAWLDGTSLAAETDEVRLWGASLAPGADLLFYGCDMAASPAGQSFLESVGSLTGADVAASVDSTGNAAMGGNWALEFENGTIESPSAVSATLAATYDGMLGEPHIHLDSSTLTYVENAAPLRIDANLDVQDDNNSSLVGAVVHFRSGFVAGEDMLTFVSQYGITGNYNSATGTLTLTGKASVSNWEGVLRSVAFYNTSDLPNTGTRDIEFIVSDGNTPLGDDHRMLVVTQVNDSPVAHDDYYAGKEGAAVNVASAAGVLRNDWDVGNGPIQAILSTGPAHGTLTFSADGSFLYTPQANFHGTDTFTYRANDFSLNSNLATVTITIASINTAPTATADSYSVAEDGTLNVGGAGILTNDSDIDGDALTARLVSGPAHGTLVLAANGTFSYTPAANYTGNDSFTYQANDGSADSGVATVNITVAAANDAPRANDDSYATSGLLSLGSVSNGVLANDTDVDGSVLTATLVSGPSNGTLNFNADGTFDYTPDFLFLLGTDTFTYQVSDGTANSNVATVSLHVGSLNAAPDATPDSYSLQEGTTVNADAATGVLANDNDLDTLTALLVSGPAHGSLTLNADGSFSYTPAAEFQGADSFTYQAYDGTLLSSVATVSLTVTPVDNAPLGLVDNYSVVQGGTLTTAAGGGVLRNDSDPEGQALTAVLVSGASHGVLNLGSDGSFSYTPAANFHGMDTFTYKANDGTLDSNPTTVTFTVSTNDLAPIATNDAYTTSEDAPLTISASGVLGNDSDPEGDPLTAQLVHGPRHGTLTLNADGSFTYTPAANYSGTDTFTYQAFDGAVSSNVGTVTLTVAAVPDAPVAVNDSYTVNEDANLNVAGLNVISGVLANDYDVEADALTATLVSGPSHGTLNFNSDGSFSYRGSANYNGTDSFTYRANAGGLSSSPATVTITVVPVNDPPSGSGDTFTINEDTSLTVAAPGILGNDSDVDGDTLIPVLTGGPAHGSLSLQSDGSFQYTPDANYNGSDTFTYRLNDGTVNSPNVTVTLNITPVNDPPSAVDNSYTVNEDATLNVGGQGILANDIEVDNDPLTITILTGPANGTLSLNANGSFSYRGNLNYNGTDSFTYKINDGTVDSNVATVSFTINAVNDVPITGTETYTIAEDNTLTVAAGAGVLINDSDVEGSPLTAGRANNPAHGTLTLNADGSFVYTPDANYNGTDTFTYRANDGTADSPPTTVTIVVTPVNDAPVAVSNTYTVNEDTTLTVNGLGILANDSDVDGDPLTLTLLGGTTSGILNLNANGSFTYRGNLNFNGIDSFTYKISDGTVDSNVGTVTITVNAVNDTPVAGNDSYTIAEDNTLTIPAGTGVLSNDSDVESSLSAVRVANPTHGTLTLNADGSFIYTPTANYNGTDSFTYRANDGSVNSNIATVTITVTPVNDPPVAANDSYSVNEDTTLTIAAPGILVNDIDVDNNPLTLTLISGTANGTLTLNGNGSFTYRGNLNFNGTDSFTYKVNDGTADSNVATVTITVNAVNDPPVATGDSYAIAEDSTLTVAAGTGLLSNDTDVEGSPLTASRISSPLHGVLTLNANGSFSYTPDANYNGTDSFSYRASDGLVNSNIATVTITVTPVNDPPVAASNSYTIAEDGTLTVAAPGVIGNDADVDNDPLSAVVVTGPNNGTLTLNSNGALTYKPNANFSGADSFTYKVNDGTVDSNATTVAITVTPVNDPPVAVNDNFSTSEDTTLTLTVPGILGNDIDVDGNSLTAVLVAGPANGTLMLNANGSLTYTPRVNFNGSDSFTYQASDGSATSNTATVTITVAPVNDAPVAVGNSFTTTEDTPLNIAAPGVLGNDSDVDGDTLSAALVVGPAHGTLILDPAGSFRYTPAANYNGSDSFTYTVTDGSLNSNVATVNLTITALNDAPLAVGDGFTFDEDSTLSVPGPAVLTNDSDVDGDALIAILVGGPAHGTLTLNANGSFNYTPIANFNGTDSFTYKANDGTLDSNVATVTLTVAPVNDVPVAADNSYNVAEDTPLTIAVAGVLANDSDVDGDALSAVLVTGPTHGTLTLRADGSFDYQAVANYNGTDSFTYKAGDGTGYSSVATVTIGVTPVNDTPAAANDSYSVAEDTPLAVGAPGVLGNDGDVDGDPLTAMLVAGPTHGTLVLKADGSYVYTPAANFSGSDSFSYRASDGLAFSNAATVAITVTAVNDAPVAVDDGYSTAEDTPLVVGSAGLLGNDSDVDADVLSVRVIQGPAHGTLALSGDGSFAYTPNANYNGTDSFTYRAGDGSADSNLGTVSLVIAPVNDAPTTTNDNYTISEDTTLSIGGPGILANDGDVDGDLLSAILASGPLHGALNLTVSGGFSYTPGANYNGSDSFTYWANDGTSQSNLATVTINVTPVNDAPVAGDDAFGLSEDATLTVSGPGLLTNDLDLDGQSLQTILVTGPAHGVLTLAGDGSFSYTPAANFNGTDSFTYRVSDGLANSNLATVTLTVTAVNDAPEAHSDAFGATEDVPLVVGGRGVLANDSDVDGDPIGAVLVSGPAHGVLTLQADGSFSYTPNANYNGIDSFTYVADDGSAQSSAAVVTISVAAVNDVPVALGSSYTIGEDATLIVAAPGILGTPTDVDGDPLGATLISPPANGLVSLNPDGSFTYTPFSNFNGSDTFLFQISDGTAFSNVAAVNISVTPVNDAPLAHDDSYATTGTLNLTGSGVLANDIDVDGNPLTAVLVSSATHGILALRADGTLTYDPDPLYVGVDSFTYKASDGVADSGIVTVTLLVGSSNVAPVAGDDSFTLQEDQSLTFPAAGVLANDTDSNGDPLNALLISGPQNGNVTLNADGSFTYTPAANFSGTDTFTYQANDGTLNSSVATVTLVVMPRNDPPVAHDDTYVIAEDGTLDVVGAGILHNDADPEGSALTAEVVAVPAHGTLALLADGSFHYRPDANYSGVDTFTYQANDGSDLSNVATVSITVTPVNDAPVAAADVLSVDEDTQLNIAAPGLLQNDVDVDGDALAASLVSGPTHGSLTLNANGSLTYRPDANYNGQDSFTYLAGDGALASNVATVMITVNPVNDAPVAAADSYVVDEDTALTVAAPGLLANDTDIDGDLLSTVLVSGPTHGTLSLSADGSFQYTPAQNFQGSDSFIYRTSDGSALSGNTMVAILVNPVNDAPTAGDDAYTMSEDSSLTVSAQGVLTNDADVDGDALAAVLISSPAHGTLVLHADGSITYTADANYNGSDAFTYQSSDGAASSNIAHVTIAITPANDAPSANADSFATSEDGAVTGIVLANDQDIDGDTLSALLVAGPAHGILTLHADGTFTYTPDANYHGGDAFTYQASDGTANSNVAQVTIAITPSNDAPIANPDSFVGNEDMTLTGAVLGNDQDIDGDTLTAVLVAGPAHGTLVLNADGTFTYTPGADFTGADGFAYQASDGASSSGAVQVTINIAASNDAPLAHADAVTTTEDTLVTGNVLANDQDVDGDTLAAVLVAGPAHGTLTLHADGTFTYTPDANYYGGDGFTYLASDGTAISNVAQVTIVITPSNDAPIATPDSLVGNEDVAVTGAVLGNDQDIDGDTLTAVLVTGPAHGTLVLNTDGTFTYTPDADFHGGDVFTYGASDGMTGSNVAQVTIIIAPSNDAPVANGDTFVAGEDAVVLGAVLGNDRDVDGDTLSAVLVAGPIHGTLLFSADGTFTYTPNASYTGNDIFTYQASDGAASSNVAQVTISVTPNNDAPIANPDSFVGSEDVALTGTVIGNDQDIDGDALTAVLVAGPAHGTLVLGADGTFTYTPSANFNGSDAFTYQANDGTASSNIAQVSITVTPTNDAPVANADSFAASEDTVVTGALLGNDQDGDGDTLAALLVAGPAHGALTLDADGTFTYTPNANYTGSDVFTYQASDGAASSNVAQVTISVTPNNDTPLANPDSFVGSEDVVLTGTIIANDQDIDGDTLTAVLVAGPAHGTLVLGLDGTFTYTPSANFNGSDAFTYQASDGTASSNIAQVSITVTPTNDVPVAIADSFAATEDAVVTGALLGNDQDVDGDTLGALLVAGPAHGALTLHADGTFSYTPAADFTGSDIFTYQAVDGAASSNVVQVTISVMPNNDAPFANPDAFVGSEDVTLTGTVIGNDQDIDGDTLTAVLVAGPAHGTLVLGLDGTFTYTPSANFNGSDAFTYQASDGTASSNIAQVSITVTPTNDAPVANADSFAVREDTVVTGALLGNDQDGDGDTLAALLVAGPAHGALTLHADGTFSYTPAADFTGSDTFTYRANDGTASSNIALVSITVTPSNDAPVANADSFQVNEDATLSVAGTGILANDVDVDGDVLTAVLVSGPSHGTLTLNPDGSLVYTPDANFQGSDSFRYQASDGKSASASIVVTIDVAALNHAPIAANDSFNIAADSALPAASVVINDQDNDGDPLTISLVSGPAHGVLTLHNDGTFRYTPAAGFSGTDKFTYKVADPAGGSSTATVTITVNAAAVKIQPPVTGTEQAVQSILTTQDMGSKGTAAGSTSSGETGTSAVARLFAVTIDRSTPADSSATQARAGGSASASTASNTVNAAGGGSDDRRGGGGDQATTLPGSDSLHVESVPFAQMSQAFVISMAELPEASQSRGWATLLTLEQLPRQTAAAPVRRQDETAAGTRAWAMTGMMATTGYMLLNTRAMAWVLALVLTQSTWKELDPLEVINAREEDEGQGKKSTRKQWWNEVGLQ